MCPTSLSKTSCSQVKSVTTAATPPTTVTLCRATPRKTSSTPRPAAIMTTLPTMCIVSVPTHSSLLAASNSLLNSSLPTLMSSVISTSTSSTVWNTRKTAATRLNLQVKTLNWVAATTASTTLTPLTSQNRVQAATTCISITQNITSMATSAKSASTTAAWLNSLLQAATMALLA